MGFHPPAKISYDSGNLLLDGCHGPVREPVALEDIGVDGHKDALSGMFKKVASSRIDVLSQKYFPTVSFNGI